MELCKSLLAKFAPDVVSVATRLTGEDIEFRENQQAESTSFLKVMQIIFPAQSYDPNEITLMAAAKFATWTSQ